MSGGIIQKLGGVGNILNAFLSFALSLVIWGVMQTNLGQDSFLSSVDQSSVDWAFLLRDGRTLPHLGPTVMIDIDDAAWSDAVETRAAALAFAPRDDIVKALELARGKPGARPAAVVVDIDLSWRSPDEAAEQRIDEILESWAVDPGAPLLILIREPASGMDTPEEPGRFRAPERAGIFSADVATAPIVAATARATTDGAGRPDVFALYSCTVIGDEIRATASPILYAAAARRAPSAQAAVDRVNTAMVDATRYCRGERASQAIALDTFDRGVIRSGRRTSFINYNTSVPLDAAETGQVLIARDLLLFPVSTNSASVIPSGGELPAVVVIGSSAALSRDFFRTPLGEMSGSAIMMNALRGFEAAGPMRNLPPALEIPLIGFSVLVIVMFFNVSRDLRSRLPMGEKLKLSVRFGRGFARFLLNPVSVEVLASLLVTLLGFAITFWALDHGYFASIAGPSFAAAFNEARQEFEELATYFRAKK